MRQEYLTEAVLNRLFAEYQQQVVGVAWHSGRTGRLKTQVRKTKVPEDGICKYGIRKHEYARVENASTNLQRWKT